MSHFDPINISTDKLINQALQTATFYVPGRLHNIPESLDTKLDYKLCSKYLAKTIELESQFSYYDIWLQKHKRTLEHEYASKFEIEDAKDKIDAFTYLSNIMFNMNAAISRLGSLKNIEITQNKLSGIDTRLYKEDHMEEIHPWTGPSELTSDDLLNMDYEELLGFMRNKYFINVPSELKTSSQLRQSGILMMRSVMTYAYFLILSLKARRKKRYLKRQGESKEIIEDEIQRENLFVDFSKEMLRTYKTISRLASFEEYELNEEKMIESRKYAG